MGRVPARALRLTAAGALPRYRLLQTNSPPCALADSQIKQHK